MMLNEFISLVKCGEQVAFSDTIAVIAENYVYQPCEFSNGLHAPLLNAAGQNEGSCKIFAFAKIHNLDQQQTLALFGEYYRLDVLGNPTGTNHQNIRRFMQDGWEGIVFNGQALTTNNAA